MSEEERVAQEPPGQPTEEQRRRELLDQMRRLRVADLVEEMLVSLVTVGYQKLGLTQQTRELRDLRDARLAIETLRAWIDVLARERGEEGLAHLRATVASMQLEYARAVARPEAEETAGEPEVERTAGEPEAERTTGEAAGTAGGGSQETTAGGESGQGVPEPSAGGDPGGAADPEVPRPD